MDIGQKLKNARVEAKLTQECVAEKISVSRQTISNWENNKSYPDIVSVIDLSNLYQISLDELLKEDEDMIKYLEKSTNIVKSRQKFSKMILIISYLIIWVLCITSYWFIDPGDAMGYSLLTFYLVLPVTTVILSIFIGKEVEWANYRWMMIFFFGFMSMLAPYVTFDVSYMAQTGKREFPQITTLLPGFLSAGVGMLIGYTIQKAIDGGYRTLKKMKRIVDGIIWSILGVFAGSVLYQYYDYKPKPEIYLVNSAPWYTGVIIYGILAAMVLLVLAVVSGILKKKMKRLSGGTEE